MVNLNGYKGFLGELMMRLWMKICERKTSRKTMKK
jgi:hypothetical protein